MFYIESPNIFKSLDSKSIFLAGGITDCPDWQSKMVEFLKGTNYILLNPRRENFPIDNPDASLKQITWEHHALRYADLILFWFPKETLCPIVLYELGAWTMTHKPLCVGVDSGYKRRQDVEIQTQLVRPNIKIASTLTELANQVINYQWK